MAHEFIWEVITITLTHEPNWLNTCHDHLEIRSAERIPITGTQYRSQFTTGEDLALFVSPEAFVR